jgi:hypothetical protein
MDLLRGAISQQSTYILTFDTKKCQKNAKNAIKSTEEQEQNDIFFLIANIVPFPARPFAFCFLLVAQRTLVGALVGALH